MYPRLGGIIDQSNIHESPVSTWVAVFVRLTSIREASRQISAHDLIASQRAPPTPKKHGHAQEHTQAVTRTCTCFSACVCVCVCVYRSVCERHHPKIYFFYMFLQVIIKKFQIPCPLPILDAGNETMHMFNSTPHSDNVTTDDDTCKPKYFVYNSQTVYAIPILTFAFVCHPTILPMYDELKDRSRRKMQNVANVSFLAMFIMYLLAALFGYLTFNSKLAYLSCIRTSVGHLLFPGKDFSWIRHVIITLSLLAGTNILVIFVPSIRDIFGFIGISKCFTSYETQKHNSGSINKFVIDYVSNTIPNRWVFINFLTMYYRPFMINGHILKV
uniref:Sodium-coupled neutral amino acid symporter 2 n=1 Tax=Xiphophorus couchianus TaxID=32473 RepID=A0A3B5KR35_9TELE